MTTPAVQSTPVQGLGYDNDQMSNLGVLTGFILKWFGMSGATNPSTNVANQQGGFCLLPKQTVTGRYTTTFTHAAQKVAFKLTLLNMTNLGVWGSDTTGLISSVWLDNISGNTVTIGYQVATAMAQDWAVYYEVVGN